jgi:hypothetical protein
VDSRFVTRGGAKSANPSTVSMPLGLTTPRLTSSFPTVPGPTRMASKMFACAVSTLTRLLLTEPPARSRMPRRNRVSPV